MNVDLVKIVAGDGLRLDGAFHESNAPNDALVDAIVMLPGVAATFYGSTILEDITPPLLECGIQVLWANTRGHDLVYTAAAGFQVQRYGAAYEHVDQCRLDVSAWCDYLVSRGSSRIGLIGHSLGAIKALYSQAHQPHRQVCRIAAASPPRLSHAAFQHGEQSLVYEQSLRSAEKYVAEGRPQELMEVEFPFPLLITASGYLSKYGRDEKFNILRFVEQVKTPMLFTYGQVELSKGGIAFSGLPDLLMNLADPQAAITVAEIPDANHMYVGVRDRLASTLVDWFRQE